MSTKKFLGVLLTGIVMNLILGKVHAEESRSMLEGNFLAAEAGIVNLVTNSSGEVIQVRVEDCGQCEKSSYLPTPRLEVIQSGNPSFSGDLSDVNGQGGTVVVDKSSGLVVKVIFWVPRGERR